MTNAFAFAPKQFDTQSFDALFAPARAFAALSVNMTEKLVNAQFEATRHYADTGLSQLRNLASVQDAESLKHYMGGQQAVTQALAERVKGDAETLVGLQQEFVEQSQKLTQQSVNQAQESAKASTKTSAQSVSKAAKSA